MKKLIDYNKLLDMSTTLYQLNGGGTVKIHSFSEQNGGRKKRRHTIASYDDGSGNEVMVDTDYAKKMIKEKGHRSKKVCDPNDPSGKIQLKIVNGKSVCVRPDVMYKINKMKEERKQEDEKAAQKFARDNNISDYVGPYMPDMVQKKLLGHMLGTDNVSQLVHLTASKYYGDINVSCPPSNPKDWYKTETYVNPLNGQMECRAPHLEVPPVDEVQADNLACPSDAGDPLAVEKYIDFYGKARCRRPVISGEFSCPTPGNYLATVSKTLPDGTGVCVEPNSVDGNNLIMPDSISAVAFSELEEQKIANLIKMLHMSQVDYLKMKNFSKVLGSVKHLGEIKELLHQDYGYYDNLIEYAKKENNGLNLLRAAVIEKIKGDNDMKGGMNIEEMLRIANVHPSELKGGCRK